MIAVVALALLGSALAAPQFVQQPLTRTFATTNTFTPQRTQQPVFQQQPLPQQFAPAPAPIAQQPQQIVQQPQQIARSPITVIRRTELSDDNGNFETSVSQSDGSTFSENGSLEPTNDNLDKVVVKKGSYSYTSPEGVPVHIEYTADRYGFHPSGSVIPI